MIPKIIHYCWFGKKEKPIEVMKCIKSWQKYNPDYIIKEWNEDTFDITSIRFAKEAYEKQKYAFVTDVVRLHALINEGGIYLDTDVEILRPFSEELLKKNFFLGFEKTRKLMIGTAVIGSIPSHELFQNFYNLYQNRDFIKNDGTLNTTPNVDLLTDLLKKEGLIISDTIQDINGGTIYPCEYFSPKNMSTRKIKVTSKTYSIHHFAGTWIPKWKKFLLKIWIPFSSKYPQIADKIKNIIG